MKKYLSFVLALILGLTVCGCSSESGDVDGGFIRETYSGMSLFKIGSDAQTPAVSLNSSL